MLHISSWDYNARERAVTFLGLWIPVCTEKNPRRGAFFITRRGENEWQIAPVRCAMEERGVPSAFDAAGRYNDFIMLTNMRPDLDEAMTELWLSKA